MAYVLSFHWGYLIAALLFGFAMGWIAVVYRGYSIPSRAAPWLGLAIAALLAVSFFHLIPGRPGYWLDLGLVIFAVYLIGCGAGSWLRDRVVFRNVPPA